MPPLDALCSPVSPSPAFLLFRETGELLFASGSVQELTGFSPMEMPSLDAWVGRLFHRGQEAERIVSTVRQAFGESLTSDPLRFVAEFVPRGGVPVRAAFQVHLWREALGDLRILVNFAPVPTNPQVPVEPSSLSWAGMAEEVQEILDEALGCALAMKHGESGPGKDLDALSRKVVRARCLLSGAKGLARAWAQHPADGSKPTLPSRIPVNDTRLQA